MKKYYLLCFLLVISSITIADNPKQPVPGLILANIYRPTINLQDYWVSEKFDGVRAYWNGRQLVSRQGNIFQAPDWFSDPLPGFALDGELWIGRGKFDLLSGLVRRQSANWSEIRYMVFDLPNSPDIFDKRLIQLKTIIESINVPHIQLIQQFKVSTHEKLMKKLENIVDKGGEGLMLHTGSSLYKSTRTNDLLKLKKHLDAEAIVVGHTPGKGKFTGMLGSLEVETSDKRRFRIGTGFSDAERKSPPAVGTTITYKYFGLTNKGTPRFASFLRIRNEP